MYYRPNMLLIGVIINRQSRQMLVHASTAYLFNISLEIFVLKWKYQENEELIIFELGAQVPRRDEPPHLRPQAEQI